jgi:hypothetical protein
MTNTIKKVKVENMQSPNGNDVPNQFLIYTDECVYFQSYSSVIAFKPKEGKIKLDENKWDYSKTTGKYLNIFLRENKAEIQRKIDNGLYELIDLNN